MDPQTAVTGAAVSGRWRVAFVQVLGAPRGDILGVELPDTTHTRTLIQASERVCAG